ncbi:MAG: AsmA family protein [Hyphomicrobiales bacterium]
MTTLIDSTQGPRRELADFGSRPWPRIAVTAVLVLIITSAIIGPRLASRAALAAFVENRVCPELGVECRVTGPIHARLLPYPVMEAKGLRIALPDRKAAISAAGVTAELRALPLLIGRISVSHLDLAGAEIEVAAPPGGMRLFASANGAGAALADAIIAADRKGDRLTQLSFDRSRIVIHSEAPDRQIAVQAMSGLAAWPRGGELLAHFVGFVAGEAMDLRVEGPNLADLTRTEGASVSIAAVFGEDQLSYRGRLVKAPDLVAAGRLEAVLPSAKRLIRSLRASSWPSWLPDASLHISGQAFVTGRGIDFENTEFMVGRSRFAGGMSLRMTADGRPSLSGTIAAPLIELGDLPLPLPEQLIMPSFGRMPDLDLRMSALRVTIGGARIEAVAAGLILTEGRLDLTVSQGAAGETGTKLRVVATPDEAGVAIKTQASSENLDVGSVLSGFTLRPGLSGTGRLSVTLEGHGRDFGALERSLAGKATLQMKKGTLSLGAEGEPVMSIIAGDMTGEAPTVASRPFSQASFAATAERGVLDLTEGRIGEGAAQILIGGKVDLAGRSVDLSLSGAGETQADPPWRLRVTGPWSGPVLLQRQ